jgi:hypothetical protein
MAGQRLSRCTIFKYTKIIPGKSIFQKVVIYERGGRREEMSVVSKAELMERFGLSEKEIEELEAAADAADRGEWPKGKITRIGRPSLYEEETETVSHKEPKSKIIALDAKARALGISRSQALRQATDLWLMQG